MRVDQTTCVTIEARMPPLCRRSSGRAGSFLAKHTLDPQPGAQGDPATVTASPSSSGNRSDHRGPATEPHGPSQASPAGWSPVTQWMPTATSIPKSPDPGLRHIQVAITAGHPGNRGNASAGKHGDHQARAARAGVVDKLGIVDVLTEKRGAFLQYGCGSGPKLLNSTDPDGGSADIDDDICADPPA